MPARITSTPGVCGGKPCIAGRRVRVSDIVVWYEHQGMGADAIASATPGLTLADIHAALTYYYENLDSIRDEMSTESAAADRYERGADSLLRTKLGPVKQVS